MLDADDEAAWEVLEGIGRSVGRSVALADGDSWLRRVFVEGGCAVRDLCGLADGDSVGRI